MLWLIVIIILFLSALADYSHFCYVWQFKEYRFDRLRDYISSVSGKKFFSGWRILKRPLIYLALFLLLPINLKSLDIALIIVLSVDLIYNLYLFFKHNLFRPKPTVKALGLIILALITEAVLLIAVLGSHFIFIVLALRWFIFSALAILAKLPTALAKKNYLKLAERKLAGYKNLAVIGVTGSFGKTTVKNFLAQALNEKYKVLMTPENINTDIGIAKFILKNDFTEFDIFVVEMGTYKIGEIAAICRMVKPKIGVLTVISDQHLALLGNIKNTQTAKYELLKSLPDDGLAITNSDNKYCRELLSQLKCEVKTFGIDSHFNPDCLIKNVSADVNGIKFSAALKNNAELKISAPIIGRHNSLNIAPVILAGKFLNLSDEEIIRAATKIKLPPKVLQTYAYGHSLIIDDSYNANPEGFIAALDILYGYQGYRKIVITRGMLELGSASRSWHETVGKKIAQCADEIIITSPDSVKELRAGVGQAKVKIETIFNPFKLLEYLKIYKKQTNVILLEGRLPDVIKKEINANI